MKNTPHAYLLYTALLLAAALLSVAVGSVSIPLRDIGQTIWVWVQGGIAEQNVFATIILQLRIPRTLLLLLVGAALAGSGGAYQGLFRNPLADPYLIGTASGAGLGAVIAMSINWPTLPLSYLLVPVSAFIGALLTVFLVYNLARNGQSLPVTNLILAGVAVSSFTTALTSFLLINSSGELRRALVWLVGGTTLSGWKPLLGSALYILLGLFVLLLLSYRLNVLQFGEEQAQQLGIRVQRVRLLIILAASLATAAAVAFAGVIGFVGLIVPHIVRRFHGGDYRRVLPFSMLAGGSFLLFSDVLARVVMAPQELPVGIITALCGAPFFLVILQRHKRQEW